MESESSGQEENKEECLPFSDDLTQEPASQDGEAVLLWSEKPIYLTCDDALLFFKTPF